MLKQFWEVNDIHGAALYLTRVDDLAVAVDFFNGLGETGLAGTKRQPDLALDCCHLFAPFVNRLLDSAFAEYAAGRPLIPHRSPLGGSGSGGDRILALGLSRGRGGATALHTRPHPRNSPSYVLTALKTGVAMLRVVSDTIKSTSSWARDLQSAGRCVHRDAAGAGTHAPSPRPRLPMVARRRPARRRAKCEACYDEFMKIRDKVAPLTGADAPVGPAAARFAEQLESLRMAARELRQQSRQ